MTVQRSNGQATRYDLGGATHFDKGQGKAFETPHTLNETLKPNRAPDGFVGNSTIKGPVRTMTQSDVRTARRVLIERQGSGGGNQGGKR